MFPLHYVQGGCSLGFFQFPALHRCDAKPRGWPLIILWNAGVFSSKVFTGQLFHLALVQKNRMPSGGPAPVTSRGTRSIYVIPIWRKKLAGLFSPISFFLLLGKSCSLSKPFLWSPLTMHLKAISKNCCWCYTYYGKPPIEDVNAFYDWECCLKIKTGSLQESAKTHLISHMYSHWRVCNEIRRCPCRQTYHNFLQIANP